MKTKESAEYEIETGRSRYRIEIEMFQRKLDFFPLLKCCGSLS
jgi:hypothetical protein